MKSTIFFVLSALIFGHAVSAGAEGRLARAFAGGPDGGVPPEVRLTELRRQCDLRPPQLGPPVTPEIDDAVRPASYCVTGPFGDDVCDPACGSWFGETMRPGTGAWGGDRRVAGSTTLGTDTFFGFYPILSGAYALNEFVDATVYGWLWTTDNLSANPPTTTGPWTEVGGGLNFKFLEGTWQVNPQFGILNGALLSNTPSGSFSGANEPRIFDGVVPTMTINHSADYTEGQFYMGYYAATRGAPANRNDFLHWWINGGIRPWGEENSFRSTLSTGVHYEMLRATRRNTGNLYSALGPYFQVALPNGFSLRWTTGWNMDRGAGTIGRNFYKLWATYSF